MRQSLMTFQIAKSFQNFSLDCHAAVGFGITAIFGPSGSGKTTLLNCLSGHLTPDNGCIEFMGNTMYSSSTGHTVPPEKRRFGYVFQESALFPHMTVRQNIEYGYNLTAVNLRKIELDHLIELFDLSDLMDRGVVSLSGGEQQKVALARVLATSPQLLLLDEPLASVDAVSKGSIIRYLKLIQKELSTPMLYVSHSISEAIALADEMIVISDGIPVAKGKPFEVLVNSGVSILNDYSTLENLIEVKVIKPQIGFDVGEVAIGRARLLVPGVHSKPGDDISISIRASDIILALDFPTKISARNILHGKVEDIHELDTRVLVNVDIGISLVVEITPGALQNLALRRGQDVYAVIKGTSILVMGGSMRQVSV